jgi:hypothetical protein
MSANAALPGTILESFFSDHLKLQEGLRPNSIANYADAMRLLLLFAAATGKQRAPRLLGDLREPLPGALDDRNLATAGLAVARTDW